MEHLSVTRSTVAWVSGRHYFGAVAKWPSMGGRAIWLRGMAAGGVYLAMRGQRADPHGFRLRHAAPRVAAIP